MAKVTGRSNEPTRTSIADPAVQAFVKVVNSFTYKNGANAPAVSLRNLTFWVGAGFSRAWNPKYPTSAELLRIPT